MTNQRRTLAVSIATPGGDNPLLLSLVQTSSIFAGVAVSGLALVGKGGTAPYAFSILATSSNDLPDGLTVDALSGQITGTPTVAGHYSFIAQVQDDASNVFTHSFSIDVKSPIVWVRFQPTPGENLLAYSYRMLARDLAGNHITSGYTLVDGNLPDGLTIDGSGTISGTPTLAAVGFSYARIGVTSNEFTSTVDIRIEVVASLSITMFQKFVFIVGTQSSFQIEVTGGRPPYSLRYSDPTDPFINGLKLSPLGVVSGVALAANFQSRDIVVVDSLGATDDAFVQIESRNPNAQIQPQLGGADVGPVGPQVLNFTLNDTATLDVENDGNTTTVKIPAPGGGGVQSVGGVEPDSTGNVPVVSTDEATLSVGTDTAGDLALNVARPHLAVKESGTKPNGRPYVVIGLVWPGDPLY